MPNKTEAEDVWTKDGKIQVGPVITDYYLRMAKETGKPFYSLLHDKYPNAVIAFPDLIEDDLRPFLKETSEAKKEKSADVTKMYDEPIWIPPGVTSFADLDAYMESREMEADIKEATHYFSQLASNIMMSDMVEDKPGSLAKLAEEFITRMGIARGDLKELAECDDCDDDKETDDIDKAVLSSAERNNLPDSAFLYIESGGKKDESGKTTPRSLRHLPVHDLPHLRNSISRLSQSATGKAGGEKWLTESLRKSLLAKARKRLEATKKEIDEVTIINRAIAKAKELFGLKEKSQPQLEKNTFSHIWKEAGQYHWLAAYTNNFRDNDNPPEIISSDAHKEFDQAVNSGKWPMPEVWLWHYPYPVGQTHYHAYDEKSGFCIAGGTFDKDKAWAAEGIIKADWRGISHGMPRKEIVRDNGDKSIITRRRTREITFLPTKAAANNLAFHIISKESNGMDDVKEIPAHKREEFVAAFGEERVKQMEEELSQRAKQATEAGTESKEKTPPADDRPADTPTEQPSADMVEAIRKLVTSVKAIGDSVQAIDSRLKELEKSDKEKLAQKAAAIPEASLASYVESQLFTKQNQVDDKGPGPQENKAKQDGSTGLFFNELGWTQAGGRQ